MKLYGTITSERASKSQGGQEYLDILVNGETENLFRLTVEYSNGYAHTTFLNYSTGETQKFSWELRQKTIETKKLVCNHKQGTDLEGQCNVCGETRTKAKRQKDECVMHGVKKCIHCTENPYSTI